MTPNTWYALCFSGDVAAGSGKPLHVRACGQSFVVWRCADGKLVVQAAFCPHQGANLAAGGAITGDDCIVCPFHGWRFNAEGSVKYVPAAEEPCKEQPSRRLRTFPSQDWVRP